MKKIVLFAVMLVLLAGCSVLSAGPTPPDKVVVYTRVAQTMQAQFTRDFLLTPSATVVPTRTNTPEPSATPQPSATPAPTWAPHRAGQVQAPILLYYSAAVSKDENPNYDANNTLILKPDEFREQIDYLKKNGYTAIPISLLVTTIQKGAALPPRPVVLTFDVGSADIYTTIFPILKAAGYVGNVYPVVNLIDKPGMLTTAQLKELIAAGWEVGTRGMNGFDLTGSPDQLSNELGKPISVLKEKLGVEIKTVAYPNGSVDSFVAGRAERYGYLAGLGIGRSTTHTTAMLYFLPRLEIRRGLSLKDFEAMLK